MRKRNVTILQAITPIIVLIGLIMINVLYIKSETLGGSNQLAMLLASAVAVIISLYNGTKWNYIMDKVVASISSTLPAIIILFLIGMLSGAWMISGIIPSMIYYGLELLQPDYFLPATVIICAIISVAIGSSWSTVATIGVALLAIGKALGFSDGMIAGAIISGAYFGDKISPLSDTTNLSAAVCETDLFTHIKYLMRTTVPSLIITLILFGILTFMHDKGEVHSDVGELQQMLSTHFNITPILFIIPILVIILIAKKLPPIAILFIGAVSAILVTPIFQLDLLHAMTSEFSFKEVFNVLTRALYTTSTLETGDPALNRLLTTYGMAGMLNTVWFIIVAMIFGGVMDAGGLIQRITKAAVSRISSPGSLVSTTAFSGMFLNLTASDQYLAIVIGGKMFASSYDEAGLDGKVLGRTLEDSITVTSVLVPWNTCGATQATILGVSTLTYGPFAFFCILSPLMTILYGWLGKVAFKKKEEVA